MKRRPHKKLPQRPPVGSLVRFKEHGFWQYGRVTRLVDGTLAVLLHMALPEEPVYQVVFKSGQMLVRKVVWKPRSGVMVAP